MSSAPDVSLMKRELDSVNSVKLEQVVDNTELVVQNFIPLLENKNTYRLLDGSKEIYVMYEESDLCCRWCCKPRHNLSMKVMKKEQFQFSFEKPFRCFGCCHCTPCCVGKMDVNDKNGNLVATAQERCCVGPTPTIDVYNSSGEFVDSFSGPSCCFDTICDQHKDIEFTSQTTRNIIKKVHSKKQSKGGTGFSELSKFISDADDFAITFGTKNIEEKVGLIAATLLLDFMFFEGDEANINSGVVCFKCHFFGCMQQCRVGGRNNNNNNRNSGNSAGEGIAGLVNMAL